MQTKKSRVMSENSLCPNTFSNRHGPLEIVVAAAAAVRISTLEKRSITFRFPDDLITKSRGNKKRLTSLQNGISL